MDHPDCLRRLAATLPALVFALVAAGSSAAQVPRKPASLPIQVPHTRIAYGVLVSLDRAQTRTGERAAYELVVRVRDGSIRTSRVGGVYGWHVGDRVMLMGSESS